MMCCKYAIRIASMRMVMVHSFDLDLMHHFIVCIILKLCAVTSAVMLKKMAILDLSSQTFQTSLRAASAHSSEYDVCYELVNNDCKAMQATFIWIEC